MKTALKQRGLIKLAKGKATIRKGSLWHAGLYVKADHLVRNFSCTIAYSFVRKREDHITPHKQSIFPLVVVNSDQSLRGWQMHTIHIFVEYDFAKHDNFIGPRIGLFYNAPVSGQRIFKTKTVGAQFGVDIAWDM